MKVLSRVQETKEIFELRIIAFPCPYVKRNGRPRPTGRRENQAVLGSPQHLLLIWLTILLVLAQRREYPAKKKP